LAHATIHLALAPKSNAASSAIWSAMQDVRQGGVGEVPNILRDGHYKGAASLGHGVGYVSPHTATTENPAPPDEAYLPVELHGKRYYGHSQ